MSFVVKKRCFSAGAAIMAATDNAAWVGIGVALGAAIGAGMERRRR